MYENLKFNLDIVAVFLEYSEKEVTQAERNQSEI